MNQALLREGSWSRSESMSMSWSWSESESGSGSGSGSVSQSGCRSSEKQPQARSNVVTLGNILGEFNGEMK